MKFTDVDLILENEIIRKAALSRIHSSRLSVSKVSKVSKVHIIKVRSWLEKRESKINHLEIQAICAVIGINISISVEEVDLSYEQESLVRIATARVLNVKPQYYD